MNKAVIVIAIAAIISLLLDQPGYLKWADFSKIQQRFVEKVPQEFVEIVEIKETCKANSENPYVQMLIKKGDCL